MKIRSIPPFFFRRVAPVLILTSPAWVLLNTTLPRRADQPPEVLWVEAQGCLEKIHTQIRAETQPPILAYKLEVTIETPQTRGPLEGAQKTRVTAQGTLPLKSPHEFGPLFQAQQKIPIEYDPKNPKENARLDTEKCRAWLQHQSRQ